VALATSSGWYLTLPAMNAAQTGFASLSAYSSTFARSPIESGGAIAKFGIHPALGAPDGVVYLGANRPPASNLAGYYALLAENTNATATLPVSCFYKQTWSDFQSAACPTCASSAGINTCPSPVPETIRWHMVFDEVEQAWSFYSGVTRTRMVIVYPSHSSFPVNAPSPSVPYLALTNDTFYGSLFNVYNYSTTPPTKLYPIITSHCRRMISLDAAPMRQQVFFFFFLTHLAFCGDGLVYPGETCDDALTNPLACDPVTCSVIPGWLCPFNVALGRSDCVRTFLSLCLILLEFIPCLLLSAAAMFLALF
jgi:hypothetical protein